MDGTFAHLHLVSVWIDPSRTTRCVSVAILLPPGVAPGGYSIRVREDEREMELTMRWSSPINCVYHLYRVRLRAESDAIECYHPMLLGFENFLEGLRERKADIVESVAPILLPFAVETHIGKRSPLGWTNIAARVIYIDKKAYEELYSNGDEKTDFEIS